MERYEISITLLTDLDEEELATKLLSVLPVGTRVSIDRVDELGNRLPRLGTPMT